VLHRPEQMSSIKLYNMHRATDNRAAWAVFIRGQHLLIPAIMISLILGCISHIRHIDMPRSPGHREMHMPMFSDDTLAGRLPSAAGGATSKAQTAYFAVNTPDANSHPMKSPQPRAHSPHQSRSQQQPRTLLRRKPSIAAGGATVHPVQLQTVGADLQIHAQNMTLAMIETSESKGVLKAPRVPDFMYQYTREVPEPPLQLKYPLWWFGPFWSGSGYGSGETSPSTALEFLGMVVECISVLYVNIVVTSRSRDSGGATGCHTLSLDPSVSMTAGWYID
jgi:hypothetical protein